MSPTPDPSTFQLTRLPFTLFHPPQDIGDKLTLSSRLRGALAEVLDGESLILPVPPNGPPDVPRIQLESRDKSWVLQVTMQRISLEWTRRAEGGDVWTRQMDTFFARTVSFLRVVVGEYVRPVRIAINPQFIVQLPASANDYLAFTVVEPGRILKKPSSCKIGVLDQFNINGRTMNLWMNIASARQQNNPLDDHALIVHFDYNSAAEDPRPMATEEILRLLEDSKELINLRLGKFFGDLAKE